LKLTSTGSKVLASNGITSQANFRIHANAQAFRILSSGLYSDKISAVLREIGCNAADAHVAVGTPDRPIEVKLPSALDTSFHIKDWGTGLSDAEVKGLFATYFSSNKSDSDEMTGAFGLGSKSPFSYTDSFSVTTAHGGTQRAYTAHMGSDGSPVVSLLGEQATCSDWPTGMMVSFAVRPADIAEFHTKTQQTFRWFRIKPNIVGGSPVKAPSLRIVGSRSYLVSDEQERTSRLIMGNVAYPLNAQRLGLEDQVLQALLAGGIHIEVPIGAVMPTASREELEYDANNREKVAEALRATAAEIAATIAAKAHEAADTEWERHARVRAYAKALPFEVHRHVDELLDGLNAPQQQREHAKAIFSDEFRALPTWVGVEDPVPGPKGPTAATATPTLSQSLRVCRVYLYRCGERPGTTSRRAVISGHVSRGSSLEEAKLLYTERPRIVLSDAPHTHERIKELLTQDEETVVVNLWADSKEALPELSAYAKRLAEELGGVPVVRSSSLQPPTHLALRKAKAQGAKIKPEVLHARTLVRYLDLASPRSGFEEKALADVPAQSRFYLVTTGRRGRYASSLQGAPSSIDPYNLERAVSGYRALIAFGVPLEEMPGAVVLPPRRLRELGLRESGWRSLFAAMTDAMRSRPVAEALTELVSVMPKIELHNSYAIEQAGLLGALMAEALTNTKLWRAVDPILKDYPNLDGPLRELIRANVGADSKQTSAREALESLTRLLPVKMPDFKVKPVDAAGLIELLHKRYPMTVYLNSRTFRTRGNAHPQQAVRYLRTILDGICKGRAKSQAPQLDQLSLPIGE